MTKKELIELLQSSSLPDDTPILIGRSFMTQFSDCQDPIEMEFKLNGVPSQPYGKHISEDHPRYNHFPIEPTNCIAINADAALERVRSADLIRMLNAGACKNHD